MIRIELDHIKLEVAEGLTILEVARDAGIDIPTMCHLEGTDHFPSCLICVVKNNDTGRLIPACTTKVIESMNIITGDEEVKEARKTALDLLLSDHVGDCEAPCQTNCPAFMDIPLMNRLLASGKLDEALRVVKADIAMPAVLGRICPAPCERACRRRDVDTAVSICLLKRYAADHDMAHKEPFHPLAEKSHGKKVAIIGTGPAGISAAYYLLLKGYDCVLYDKNPLPGGALRYSIPESKLPKEVLDVEIESIRKLGAKFVMNHELKNDALEALRKTYDSVIIATGEDNASFDGLEKRAKAFVTERLTHRTKMDDVFAIGSAVKPGRVAIRASAHGKQAAISVDQYLQGKEVTGEYRRFNSRFGRLLESELSEYMLEADDGLRIEKEDRVGFTSDEVQKEAARCMHCDCRKVAECKLRLYADKYKATQKRFFPDERKPVRKIFKNDPIVYEPEKCIKCGICVRITSEFKEELGLTFIGKGFDVEVGAPFDTEKVNTLQKTAALCAEKCPTGALAMQKQKSIE